MRRYSSLTPPCGAFLLASRISFALTIAYGAIPLRTGQLSSCLDIFKVVHTMTFQATWVNA